MIFTPQHTIKSAEAITPVTSDIIGLTVMDMAAARRARIAMSVAAWLCLILSVMVVSVGDYHAAGINLALTVACFAMRRRQTP